MQVTVLDQGNTWTDKEGTSHNIEQMDGRYALNVYNYLLAKAQVLGFRYGLHLASIRLPDFDTAAYDHVMDAIDEEHQRINQNPRAWIKDKPLMRALLARVALDRITKEQAGYVPPTEPLPLNFQPYQAPEFRLSPHGFDLDEQRYGQRPGDETMVFLVQESDYDSTSIVAAFVGNRLAAYRYLGEFDRYGTPGEVVEMDDHANGGTPGMYAQIRKYREAWTQVTYRTSVNLETGDVTTDWPANIVTRNDIDPGFNTEKEADGGRGRFSAVISTSGSDAEIEKLRHLHSDNVNTIRANVLDDLTKDQP